MSVVNGYAATSGDARVTALRMDDFPALGRPTRPMSATTRMSSSTVSSSPCSPPVAVHVASSSSMSDVSTASFTFRAAADAPRAATLRLARAARGEATRAALSHEKSLSVFGHVAEELAAPLTADDGAGGNVYVEVLLVGRLARRDRSAGAGVWRGGPVVALLRAPRLARVEVEEVDVAIDANVDVPAATAVGGLGGGRSMYFLMLRPHWYLKFFTVLDLELVRLALAARRRRTR